MSGTLAFDLGIGVWTRASVVSLVIRGRRPYQLCHIRMPAIRQCAMKNWKKYIEHILNEIVSDYNIYYLTGYAIGKPREECNRLTAGLTQSVNLVNNGIYRVVKWYIEIGVDCITTIYERVDLSPPPENLLSSVFYFFLPPFSPHPVTLSTYYYMYNQFGFRGLLHLNYYHFWTTSCSKTNRNADVENQNCHAT